MKLKRLIRKKLIQNKRGFGRFQVNLPWGFTKGVLYGAPDYPEDYAFLEEFEIRPEHRGKGLARKLNNTIIQALCEWGAKNIHGEATRRAYPFWRKMGWRLRFDDEDWHTCHRHNQEGELIEETQCVSIIKDC